jgi:hypothetical protein
VRRTNLGDATLAVPDAALPDGLEGPPTDKRGKTTCFGERWVHEKGSQKGSRQDRKKETQLEKNGLCEVASGNMEIS